MSRTNDEKREIKVIKFITDSKEAFKTFIPRDKIDDVGITECKEKNGAFEVGGSVSTTSPTGKLKTFGYSATVNMDEDGNCSFSKLQVKEI